MQLHYTVENKHVHESAFAASTTLSHEGTFFWTKTNCGKNLFGTKVRLQTLENVSESYLFLFS